MSEHKGYAVFGSRYFGKLSVKQQNTYGDAYAVEHLWWYRLHLKTYSNMFDNKTCMEICLTIHQPNICRDQQTTWDVTYIYT